ncbi:hypothetical protein CS542_10355 [Pedobacter sp. IW39]|nr:hypothetical protein CS542_10355 [Pedobacter sp. IW39]
MGDWRKNSGFWRSIINQLKYETKNKVAVYRIVQRNQRGLQRICKRRCQSSVNYSSSKISR